MLGKYFQGLVNIFPGLGSILGHVQKFDVVLVSGRGTGTAADW